MNKVLPAATAGLLACTAMTGQAVPTAALHLTVNYPSASVTSSMFGSLPKDVALVEIAACNDASAAVLLTNGRIMQSLRAHGIEVLSRDAAISTLQAAEGRTWRSILLRHSIHGMNIVNFLVISKAVSLGPVLSNALPAVQALMQAIVPELAKDAPDHRYLNFDRDSLPDRLQLAPLDCAAGLMFTIKPSQAKVVEIAIDVPQPSAAAK